MVLVLLVLCVVVLVVGVVGIGVGGGVGVTGVVWGKGEARVLCGRAVGRGVVVGVRGGLWEEVEGEGEEGLGEKRFGGGGGGLSKKKCHVERFGGCQGLTPPPPKPFYVTFFH